MISRATLEDVLALNSLVNLAYRGESSKKGWTTEEHLLGGVRITKDELIQSIQKTDTSILKYTEAEQILGCMMLVEKENALYLGMLTVSPDLQGGGIGKKMLKSAEIFAKEKGISKIEMTVISIRFELISWYERHGYVKTGDTKPFPMDNPDFGEPKQYLEFIVMEKMMTDYSI